MNFLNPIYPMLSHFYPKSLNAQRNFVIVAEDAEDGMCYF